MTHKTITAGFFTFLMLGAAGGSYGQAIFPLREEFDLSAGAGGSILTVHAIAALLGVAAFALSSKRMGVRSQLLAATATFIAGASLVGVADTWIETLVGVGFIGFGFGVAGTAYNGLFVAGFGKQSVVMLALLNMTFGIGAFCVPLLIGFIGSENFRYTYLGMAAVGVVPVLLLFGSRLSSQSTSIAPEKSQADKNSGIVALFALLLFLQVGLEASGGAWMYTHLTDKGVSESMASFTTGSFWAAVAIGRLSMVWLTRRYSETQIAVAAVTLMVPVFAITSIGQAGVFVYALAGLLVAPIFPCVMMWSAQKTKNASHVGAILFASSLAGAGTMPLVVGQVIDVSTPAVIPFTFVAIAATCLVVAVPLLRTNRKTVDIQTEGVGLLQNARNEALERV